MEEIIISKQNSLMMSPFSVDLFNQFINYVDASSKTIDTYKRALKQLFLYLQLNNISEPTRQDIISFRDDLKDSGHKPTTVQNYITACRIFFKWTATEGYYPNIAENLKGAKLDRNHKKDYFTNQQIKDILNTIDREARTGLRDYALIFLMVTGALRTIEIERAKIEDLRTLGNNTVLYVQGKGQEEKTEYIKIPLAVEKAIRAYLKTREDKTGDAPLFTSTSNNSKGKPLTTRSISKICKQAFLKAGYDSGKLTAHSLRHTAITLSLLAGQDITEVQKFARHANIANTMIYNHAIDMANNECSNLIANSLI